MKIITTLAAAAGLLLTMAAMPIGEQDPVRNQGPVIKRLSNFRGDHFPGYAEFRIQEFEFNDFGLIRLKGEPYEVLLNVNYITQVYRYEDAKKTDHSTLMYTTYGKHPFLARQNYKDVVSSIRKAMEAMAE
jgi:hypothetical protein